MHKSHVGTESITCNKGVFVAASYAYLKATTRCRCHEENCHSDLPKPGETEVVSIMGILLLGACIYFMPYLIIVVWYWYGLPFI